MKFAFAVAIASILGAHSCCAQEAVDKAKATAFDASMFAGPLGKKTYACFVRRYDASHLAQHPRQKVSAMKLLVTAEIPPDDQATTNYSFYLGVKYRNRAGNFDSAGSCHHSTAGEKDGEIHLGCGVECDGGGITVA